MRLGYGLLSHRWRDRTWLTWGNFFDFRAVYVQPPYAGSPLPAVRLVFPDGTMVTSTQADVSDVLSGALGRRVELAQAEGGADGASSGAKGDLPKDAGILRTAARHNGANVGVYAEVIEEGTVHRGDAVTIL
jgi:hypothetical protein